MLRMNVLRRYCIVRLNGIVYRSVRYSSSNDVEQQELKKNEDVKKKSEDARAKLNLLLKQMLQEEDASKIKPQKLNLAKPNKKKKMPIEKTTDSVEIKSAEQKVTATVKEVAALLGGNKKQTESELLSKLLNAATTQKPEDNKDQTSVTDLSEIIKGMKIDRETKAPEEISRALQVRQLLKVMKGNQQLSESPKTMSRKVRRTVRYVTDIQVERVNLFGSQPLGIFEPYIESEVVEDKNINKTWRFLHERELKLTVTHPPSNYFEEMILWTEQGKVWKFPINNEQGMEEEQAVYFTEHVFVEKYLESWCPKTGPIRHFMELVCVGLSKNPYLSAQHKKEHIDWYCNYFNEKKKLLQEVGAFPDVNITNKAIENIEPTTNISK